MLLTTTVTLYTASCFSELPSKGDRSTAPSHPTPEFTVSYSGETMANNLGLPRRAPALDDVGSCIEYARTKGSDRDVLVAGNFEYKCQRMRGTCRAVPETAVFDSIRARADVTEILDAIGGARGAIAVCVLAAARAEVK